MDYLGIKKRTGELRVRLIHNDTVGNTVSTIALSNFMFSSFIISCVFRSNMLGFPPGGKGRESVVLERVPGTDRLGGHPDEA